MITVAAVAVATTLRTLLDSSLGHQAAYGPFYFAVVLSAWRGGMPQALLSTLVGLITAWYLFVPPRHSFGTPATPDQIGLAVFAAVGVSIALLSSSMRRAKLKARAQVGERMSELHASNELFRQIVEGTQDYAIFMLDRNGHVRSWNPGAARIKGYAASEILGRHFSCFYPPEQRELPAIARRLETATQTGRFEEEGWRVRKDGSRFWASVLITALRDERGELRGFSKITRDLTNKRTSEENAMRLVEAQAGRRAAEDLGVRLQQTQDALRSADRRKDEFLATLAHELRNPMAALSNGLHLLGHASDLAEAATTRAMMERQVVQLVRLIDDLMDVGRISRGKIDLQRRPVSLGAIVATALDTCGPLLRDRDHVLDFRVAPEPVTVDADEIRLAQAVGNLLHNAAKYTHAGGRITLVAGKEGDRAVIRVKDDGAGIPPEMLERVFDMFTQVDRSLDRGEGGLGIGLAIVRQLVEMHGGTVVAHSAGAGKGSEFMVSLPLVAAETARQPAVAPQESRSPTAAASRRILVVDDNEDAAASMTLLLKRTGHDVRSAADGLAGVEAADSFRPEVVFLDLGMPRMNGLDAAKRIREKPWGREMVLVALTGWGQQEDIARARNAGFDHHLVKPVEAASIASLLASLPQPRRVSSIDTSSSPPAVSSSSSGSTGA